MKVPSSIVAPVLLAVVCAAGLLGFLWLELTRSTEILRSAPSSEAGRSAEEIETRQPPTATTATRDQALLSLRQGDLAALQGEWRQAQKFYEEAVEHGGGVLALRKLAQTQLQRRDSAGLQRTMRLLKQAGARSEDLLLLESIMLLRSGELIASRSRLEGADDSPQKHYGLALLSIIQGDHERTQLALQAVISGWEPVLRSNARTLMAAYQEFSLFPEGSNAHLVTLLARALASVQECELALPLLIQVTQVNDDYRDAWIVQGYCELTTERPEQALASLEHAYNLDPLKPEIQYFLARTYADLGNSGNAITFFEYAIQNGFSPESEARQRLAEEARKAGRAELSLAQYQLLSQADDAGVEAYESMVALLIDLGRIDEAVAAAKEAVEALGEDAGAYALLGTASIAAKRPDEAAAALRRALEINPYLQGARERLQGLETGS